MDQLPNVIYLIGIAGGPILLAGVLIYAMRRRKRSRQPGPPGMSRH